MLDDDFERVLEVVSTESAGEFTTGAGNVEDVSGSAESEAQRRPPSEIGGRFPARRSQDGRLNDTERD
ncbi:hypothetical protein [Natrinema gelatinilyticum]|uniref:hypothetical protein n=1 Tax=Natrinema gelatinilyticum TaxID=2961571 RepID=UPI0020C51274|nr:hypothetical protein [Natrinema gelatinilyticum]